MPETTTSPRCGAHRVCSTGLLALLVVVSLLMSACGGSVHNTPAARAAKLLAPAQVDATDGLTIDGEKIADKALYDAARGKKLVLYSAAGKEAEDLTLARFTAETGIQVELTRLPNNKLAERALSEHGAGRLGADVIRLTDPRTARDFGEAGVYVPYRTPFHDKLAAAGATVDANWFPAYYFVNAMAYNSAIHTQNPPDGWEDLADPRYEGQLGIVAITTGGTLQALTRFQIEEFGPQYLDRLAAQQPRVFNSTSTEVDALARGEISIATVSFNNAFGAQSHGAPIRLVVPEEGVSASEGPLGLTPKGADNPAAQVFANWSLSKAGQKFVGSQGFVPVRTDIGPVRAGEYELPTADSPRFHLLDEDGFARHAEADEKLWKQKFDFIG
ncbi:ABC transporter substrate-binding protein [Saccharopolyspora erythraea]|uniref:ABC transporter substrate-binding protein n=1 Tax=Saccharopolyspora erythraea TaxID=1836 RepID=UPI002012D829|nr:extracellular solute-binding protein [Saccharopolyspora erythraea]